jgi:hypothetical protein
MRTNQNTGQAGIPVVTSLCLMIILSISCRKNDEPGPDFRDVYTGDFIGLLTYNYPTPGDDGYIHWKTDTVLLNTIVNISKDPQADSSLIVKSAKASFTAKLDPYFKDQFTCMECNGPPDYVKYNSTDSIYVFIKYGVAASYNFDGIRK